MLIVLGTRPQIVKSAPIILEMAKSNSITARVVHTGQHYDYQMSESFFEDLGVPIPKVSLGVGSGTHAWQTAEIMKRLEVILDEMHPDLVLVPGDTNSALGAALAAAKLGIPIAHVEAGARSYDFHMTEEINRRLIDHCSSLLYAVSANCKRNLLRERVPGKSFNVGDPMCDTYLSHLPAARASKVRERLGLGRGSYAVLTMHRAENVEQKNRLRVIVNELLSTRELRIVFPIHPRTLDRLSSSGMIKGIRLPHMIPLEPVTYHDMMRLVLDARVVLTDSGGLQKEALWARTPCITLRERTEWVETVKLGANFLVDKNFRNFKSTLRFVIRNSESIRKKLLRIKNPYRPGASRRIALSICRNIVTDVNS